LTGRHDRSSDT